MTKKTALEWFLEAIGYKQESDRTTIINIHPDCDITDLIKQAKQMEKEQIMTAHTRAYLIGEDTISIEDANIQSEQYYNEAYGTEG